MEALQRPGTQAQPYSSVPFALLLGWFAATAAWWGIALIEIPADMPDWVVRARYICFGTPRTGLPDVTGWMLLVASPGSFLLALIAIWGTELRGDLTRRWRGTRTRVGLVAVAILLAAGGAWVADRIVTASAQPDAFDLSATGEPMPEAYPRLDRPAPAFELVDRTGSPVSLGQMQGELVFLTFAFAHCNAICPATVQNVVAGAQDAPGPRRVVVITLDPWRDTARSLGTISAQWGLEGGRGVALSGDIATVNAVLDAYGVVRQRDTKTGDIVHPGLVYVIDRAGRIAYAFNQPPPSWVAEAGRRADAPAAGEAGSN